MSSSPTESASAPEHRFAHVFAVVARNHALTRLLLAYLVMILAEFGQWIALIVYAYARSGASGAGLVVILQLIGLCLLTPLLASVRPLRAAAQEPDDEEGALSDLLVAARVILTRPNTRALVAFPAGAAAIEGAVDLLVGCCATWRSSQRCRRRRWRRSPAKGAT
jgi:hypothetical protein